MDTANGNCSLYLCPQDHEFIYDETELVSLLLKIGLISKKINTHLPEHNYLTGDQFLNHISYMGCAPTINFEPSETQPDFCSISIHQYDSAKLIYSRVQARPPHCPVCKKPVRDWQNRISKTELSCGACNTTSGIESFNWRKMAGYAHLFIEISDVFPKEAVPQQALLDYLANKTGTDWRYFYSCQ